MLRIFNNHALGDFYLKQLAGQLCGLQHLFNQFKQIVALQLMAGQIDRQRNMTKAPCLPGHRLTAGFIQYLLTDGGHQPNLFGQG